MGETLEAISGGLEPPLVVYFVHQLPQVVRQGSHSPTLCFP